MIPHWFNNHTITLPAEPTSFGRRAALAAETFVKFGGISKDDCFVSSLGALIPRRHPAITALASRLCASDDGDCLIARPAVEPRYARSPLNNHRSGDQQHKKDRHQYRGY
jgi:hypothetical protein